MGMGMAGEELKLAESVLDRESKPIDWVRMYFGGDTRLCCRGLIGAVAGSCAPRFAGTAADAVAVGSRESCKLIVVDSSQSA